VIKDNRVSRKHLKLEWSREKAVIEDQKSTNGTFVNGKKIKRRALRQNDKIHISPTTIFKFSLADEDEKVALKEEMSHSKRFEVPLSLVMIDIDHFKKINDTHGHLAGDYVLIKTAELLKSMCRKEDVLARYGGEEFLMILRNTDEEGAALQAERIRKEIASTSIVSEGNEINITISLGVACIQADSECEDYKKFIKEADQSLYQSKKQGRNCTTKASELDHKPI